MFAPHNDDEVLGVGGTIIKHVRSGDEVTVCEVTSGPLYKTLQSEARNAHSLLGVEESIFLNLPVSELADMKKIELNDSVGKVVNKVRPHIVYIPFIGDMHLDHRYVTEAALVAVRPVNNCPVKKVYMYETLSETGWNLPYGERNFTPNVWVDITDTIDDKIAAMKCYQTQIKDYPNPRSEKGIKALAMFRGSTVGYSFAEAFMLVRELLGGVTETN